MLIKVKFYPTLVGKRVEFEVNYEFVYREDFDKI